MAMRVAWCEIISPILDARCLAVKDATIRLTRAELGQAGEDDYQDAGANEDDAGAILVGGAKAVPQHVG